MKQISHRILRVRSLATRSDVTSLAAMPTTGARSTCTAMKKNSFSSRLFVKMTWNGVVEEKKAEHVSGRNEPQKHRRRTLPESRCSLSRPLQRFENTEPLKTRGTNKWINQERRCSSINLSSVAKEFMQKDRFVRERFNFRSLLVPAGTYVAVS